jgi:RNA polymerase sigma factor (sigma-70 family)
MDFALPNAGNGLSSLMQSSPAMRGNTPLQNPALGSTSLALDGNSEDEDDPAEAANSIADILYHLFGDDALSHLDDVLPMMQYARDWDESKVKRHAAGKREGGRFAAKHDAASLQDMHNNIASSLKGQKSPDSAKALASHLGNLTISQLHDLKKQYGISASGRTKQDLVSKIADRLDRGRRTPDEQMPPEEQQQPEQPPEESALPETPPAGPQAPAGPPIPAPLQKATQRRKAMLEKHLGPQEEPFQLKAEPAPRPAPAVKLTNPNTQQQSLFDAGRGDLPGQQTLFDDISTLDQPDAQPEPPAPAAGGFDWGDLLRPATDFGTPQPAAQAPAPTPQQAPPAPPTPQAQQSPVMGDDNTPFFNAIKQVNPRFRDGDAVHIPALREALAGQMPPEAVDQWIDKMVTGRMLAAHRFDRPQLISPEERSQLWHDPESGAYHNTLSAWINDPSDWDKFGGAFGDAVDSNFGINSANKQPKQQPANNPPALSPQKQPQQAVAPIAQPIAQSMRDSAPPQGDSSQSRNESSNESPSTEPNRSADKIAKLRKSAGGDPNSAMTKAAKNTLKNTFGIDVDKEASQPAPEPAAKPAPAGMTPGADPALNGPEAQRMDDMVRKNQSFIRGAAQSAAKNLGLANEDGEDLAGTVMLELFEAAPTFQGGEDELRAFASTIAKRRALDLQRKGTTKGRDKRRTSSLDAPLGENGETMAGNVMDRSSAGGPDNRMFDKLHQMVGSLPQDQGDLLKSLFFDEQSGEQVGKSLGVSRETVAQRKKKALANLLPLMEAEQYRRKNPRLFAVVESEIDRYFREHTLVDPQVERYFLFGGQSGMLGMLMRGLLTAALFSLVNGTQGGQQAQAAQPKPRTSTPPAPSPFSDISPFDELDSDSQPMVDDSGMDFGFMDDDAEPAAPREPAMFDTPLSGETPNEFGDWFGDADTQPVDTGEPTQNMGNQTQDIGDNKTSSWPSWDDPSHPRHKKGDEQGRGGQFAPKDQGTSSSPPEAPESPETLSAASDDTNDVRQQERASGSTPEAQAKPYSSPYEVRENGDHLELWSNDHQVSKQPIMRRKKGSPREWEINQYKTMSDYMHAEQHDPAFDIEQARPDMLKGIEKPDSSRKPKPGWRKKT